MVLVFGEFYNFTNSTLSIDIEKPATNSNFLVRVITIKQLVYRKNCLNQLTTLPPCGEDLSIRSRF